MYITRQMKRKRTLIHINTNGFRTESNSKIILQNKVSPTVNLRIIIFYQKQFFPYTP